MDPTDVLDRLVAGAAMAMRHADASNVEWIAVLQRVASAAAATDSLREYAVACVEKSAALGGQAPFRVARIGRRRFSQVQGKELWRLLSGLLEGAYGLSEGLLAGEQAPTAVLIRTAATTAIVASRNMRYACRYAACLGLVSRAKSVRCAVLWEHVVGVCFSGFITALEHCPCSAIHAVVCIHTRSID